MNNNITTDITTGILTDIPTMDPIEITASINTKITSEMNTKWYCYILKNNYLPHKNRTYNGFTNNLKKRLRQHNQEIKGGARYTTKFGNKTWNFCAFMTGFPDKYNALQCEWRIKHPDNKRSRSQKYNSPSGRINGLKEVLRLPQWTNNSTILNKDFNMEIWVLKDYVSLLSELPDNIKINIVKDFNMELNILK
jgi:structure-specific endonuclease subunit SLX1